MTQGTGAGDERLSLGLGIGLGLALLLAIASAWVMNLQADEAWILLGIQGLAENGVYAHQHGLGTLTTGGVHTVAELLLILAAGNALPVLRLFPLLCFALLMLEIVGWARRAGHGPAAALLVVTPLVALPGTLTLAGSAFGALPALLLVAVGLRLWDDADVAGWKRPLLAGAVLGLAAATRLQASLILPALALGSLGRERPWREQVRPLGFALVTGAVVFAASYAGLMALTGHPMAGSGLAAQSAGVGISTPFAFVAKKWAVGESFFSLPLLVATTALAGWLEREAGGARRLRILTVFGWLVWLVWLAYSPRAHLRYLWLGLAPLAIVLGFGLAAWYERERSCAVNGARRAAVAVGIACLVAGALTTARNIGVGDFNVLFWEWRRRVAMQPVLRQDRLQPAYQQARLARRLAQLPADAIVVADHPVELEFLSGRHILSLERVAWRDPGDPGPLPGWIALTSHTGGRIHLRPQGWAWLEENCRVDAIFGDYVLYQVVGKNVQSLVSLRPRSGPWRPSRGLGQLRENPPAASAP